MATKYEDINNERRFNKAVGKNSFAILQYFPEQLAAGVFSTAVYNLQNLLSIILMQSR